MAITRKPIKPKKLEVKEAPKVNVQASVGTKSNQKVIKEGTPLEHSKMHNINKNDARTVGVNIGATVNMGDFNSLRIDCWATDYLKENETHEEGLQRLAILCKEEVDRQIQEEQELS